MTDSIQAADVARRRLRLRQGEVARELGITQGHYSKVLNRHAPLTHKLDQRIMEWLSSRAQPTDGDAASARMRDLAASIRGQCIELMHLVEQVSADPGGR